MGNNSHKNLIEGNPEKLGGTPVFRGTRVPIKNLFDYLEGGDSLEVFLSDFPTVTREQAVGVLELFKENFSQNMRLLLDECVPKRLKRHLLGHVTLTINEAGLEGLENGKLLIEASKNFDVLIHC